MRGNNRITQTQLFFLLKVKTTILQVITKTDTEYCYDTELMVRLRTQYKIKITTTRFTKLNMLRINKYFVNE